MLRLVIRVLFLGLIVGMVFLLFLDVVKRRGQEEAKRKVKVVSSTPSVSLQRDKGHLGDGLKSTSEVGKIRECAFVVYWTAFASLNFQNYDKFLYFGIAPELNGGVAKDQGFKKIDSFVKSVQNKERALVVRIVDKRLAGEFLQKKGIWQNFLGQVFYLAVEKGFSEISFDIELSPFQENLRDPLVEFLKEALKESKKRRIKISFIAYADSFYRKRPFDFEKISGLVDEVYLMAYDFTKNFSEPGPNFPLEKGEWNYSLLQAVEDFLKYFNREKITVIFGVFGYKWALAEDGRPLNRAKALSFNSIKKNYLQKCAKKDGCQIKIDDRVKEKVLEGKDFVIWYEDEETFRLKKQRLKREGISSFCYFALGYF